MKTGIFPLRDVYYEPMYDSRHLLRSLDTERALPAINWNLEGQLDLLRSFDYSHELNDIPTSSDDDVTFFLDHGENSWFDAGDAEYLYNIVRQKKPAKIVEIGSGFSTLMAARAIRANRADDPSYACEHVCIEPYENPWLAKVDVKLVRERVEKADPALFAGLGENDILFIDSTHVIRPQGDVVFEFLELLPTLAKGVIVHVHDIFTPRDYPTAWVKDDVRFYNEQYLFEAFLSHNPDWQVLGALNYLAHHHHDLLLEKAPYLQPKSEPASFWIQRVAWRSLTGAVQKRVRRLGWSGCVEAGQPCGLKSRSFALRGDRSVGILAVHGCRRPSCQSGEGAGQAGGARSASWGDDDQACETSRSAAGPNGLLSDRLHVEAAFMAYS